MEARLRRFDGEYRWFVFRTRPLVDASGQIVKWCGINTDIEDHRRSEEAQRTREEHYRSIADSIPALIAFMTPTGEVESVNRHVLEYFGTTLEELKGWTTGDAVHPDDLPAVIAAWKRAIDTGEPYEIEQRMRRADGIYRWFHVRGLPLRDAQDRVARWYVLETDIDDRKRAEALLAGEKRLLEMVAGGQFDVGNTRSNLSACRSHGQRMLLQRRLGRSERHASRTRSRTEPSGQFYQLDYWPARERRIRVPARWRLT